MEERKMSGGGAHCFMDWGLVASLPRGSVVEIVTFVDNFSVY